MSDHPRILTLAGAGTGKTQVLTHRIARLWEQGTDPANMLALTFTRAAGAEMKERVIGLIGDDGKRLFCNTFHAFAVEVIRDNAEALGYDANFSIYGRAEQDELLKEVMADLKYKGSAKAVYAARAGDYAHLNAVERKAAGRVVSEYIYRLKQNNALDFDELISQLQWVLFDQKNDPAPRYRELYRHVFLDEFQDTDPEQWRAMRHLNPDNLFVVGDDFQSIYGFRGSDVGIILGLAKSPEWHTVKLEQNYRSTKPIIAAANALIRHNAQTEKILTTDKDGAEIEYREASDDEAEIIDIIERLEANQTLERHKTTAILARTNRQIDKAKAILTARGVRCETTSGAENPLAHPGTKRLIAWVDAMENPENEPALSKIATAALPKSAMLEVWKAQYAGSLPLADAIRATEQGEAFMKDFDEAGEAFKSKDLPMGLMSLITRFKIEPHRDAIHMITNWARRQAELGESATAKDMLAWARLCNILEKPAEEHTPDRVYLMTVHGSKGLEFDEVFIIGAAAGTFPGGGDIEEERRLFYVAMTRAREYLNICRPLTISGWNGKLAPTERSRFIGEALKGVTP
jgi:DNA helicase-2/ATP-dependent DNA helicase PcrA